MSAPDRRSPAATGSTAGSARAACRPCSWRPTRCWSARWRSSCWPSTSPRTRTSSPASGARRCRRRASSTRTSSRCSTPARIPTASATTSSWSTWTAPRPPTCCASTRLLDIEQTVRHRARRLPRARLRPPRRRHPPRRQAGQPAAVGRDRNHQARRLRDRQGGRADAHHPGRLRARHRRLPVARAGPRRGSRPGLGHLLARRVRVPVPDRAAAPRVHLADRAGAQAAAGARSQPITEFRPEVPPQLDEAIRLCLERDPGARYRSALEMAEAIEAGAARPCHRRHAAPRAERRGRHVRRSTPPPRRAPCARTPYDAAARLRRADRRAAARATTATPGAPPAGARMATFFALLLVLAAIAAVGARAARLERQRQRRLARRRRPGAAADPASCASLASRPTRQRSAGRTRSASSWPAT